MTSGVNNNSQVNQFGTVNKVGTTAEGRAIYAVVDGSGAVAGHITLPQNQCDKFEHAYQNIIEVAPKMNEYLQKNSSPERKKQIKRRSKELIFGSAAIGALIPALLVKGGKHEALKQICFTIGGFIAGLAGGIGLNYAFLMPPGTIKMTKASKELSKLDIKAV